MKFNKKRLKNLVKASKESFSKLKSFFKLESQSIRSLFHVSKYTAVFLVSALIVAIGFFVGPVFEDAHLWYIHSLSSDVVEILNQEHGGGTGFLIRGKSGGLYVMTNNHICDSAKDGPLIVVYQGNMVVSHIIRRYQYNDLCVISAPTYAKSSLKLAKKVYSGERAYSIGHPYLEGDTVTQGELSAEVTISIAIGQNVDPETCKGPTYNLIDLSLNPMAQAFGVFNQCIRSLPALSSSINIMPGNSGSPTVDIWGHVVAVVFAANEYGSHSYHVPLSSLKDFLDDL